MKNAQQTIKRILVARSTLSSLCSPYLQLAEKYNLAIDFKPFTRTVSISLPEFRRFKASILSHTALIFTSKTAIDYFFQLTKAAYIQLPATTKYFCFTDPLANYLQKYIVLKKRKVFKVQGHITSFVSTLKKHKKEHFLIPSSVVSRKDIIEILEELHCSYTKIVVYKILENDLRQIITTDYDIIVLFSLLDVQAFIKSFPKFTSQRTKIAVFGTETAKAVKELGLSFHIYAPTDQARSMVDALKLYLKK